MRRSLHLFRAVLSLVGLFAATAPISLLAIEPTDYERGLIAERRAIAQLHLEMDMDRTSYGVQLTRSKMSVWQDGDKRRCDEIREYLDGKGITEVPPHRFVFIETPEHLIFWEGRPLPPPNKRSARFSIPSERESRSFGSPVHDARTIGLGMTLHPREMPWDWIIASPDRITPATVEINGGQIKVSYTRISKKTHLTVEQLYEKRGDKHLLLSMAAHDKEGQRTTMECTYPDQFVAGLSFPDSIEWKNVSDGTVIIHEQVKIRLKSVNETFPPSTFSLAAAALPPGTPVNGDAIPPELMKPFHHIQWDGEALVPVDNSEIILGDDQAPRF